MHPLLMYTCDFWFTGSGGLGDGASLPRFERAQAAADVSGSGTGSPMQFGTRTASSEPAFMGTWQPGEANLLFRMSQQELPPLHMPPVLIGTSHPSPALRHDRSLPALLGQQPVLTAQLSQTASTDPPCTVSSPETVSAEGGPRLSTAIRCTLVNCTCECFQPGKINLRTCDQCKHGWVAHALDKLSTQHLYHPTQVEIVQSNVVFDISSLMLYGTQAVPVRLKILLDRLFSVLKQEEVLHILHGLGWTLRDYVRGYILQDAAGKVLDRWAIMSREEEIITLQQFLRFGETKSIVELMAIQEKEGQAVAVPSSKVDSDIRSFIEGNNRTRSPSLLTHLENSNPSSVHHFENMPNSLAFLLPFQYINPVSAPLLGLPPNGLLLEQPSLRLREASLSTQNEFEETSESEVSPMPYNRSEPPSNRNALSSITNVEPKSEPGNASPRRTATPISEISKQEHTKSSFRIHRMRRMGSSSRKGRVFCNACGKTFYDKGTLKIHYNAVHLKIKHRCTIDGCNMVFSSLRSRNRHSANPNPRLHMPMLRNNRDKDLIRATSGAATPVIASTKSSLTLSSPGRPPMGFSTPPLDPVLQNSLPSQMVFPTLKTVQPVPPFYRSLLTPGDMGSSPSSLPTSPIISAPVPMEQPAPAPTDPPTNVMSMSTHDSNTDLAPKKKPRKSSMPVKIEKEIIDTADEFDEDDDHDALVNDTAHDTHSHSQDDMSPGLSLKGFSKSSGHGCISRTNIRADSMTSEDQEHERDFENESDISEPKYCEESMESDEHHQIHRENHHERAMRNSDKQHENHIDSHQQAGLKVKEEFSDPTYDMFYMSQYGLFNGGSASMAALHESFASSLNYGSPHKYSPDGDLCSSPDPKICYVCKKSFKSSYSVKLHYRNVHLKEMHVCTVAGCNAAFPSRRSRDRHSANINLHRKLLTKELDDMGIDTSHPSLRDEFLMKIYGGQHHMGFDVRDETSSPVGAEESHMNGFGRGISEDYVVLDLSTTSSIQSSSSIHSSRESDAGSDEGILLDDTDEASDGAEYSHKADAMAIGGDAETPDSHMFNSMANGGIMCNMCHKLYSNKGTLRVHYKTVHLREMHKCKVLGCNMMFSSVRSRNRHSQNPNLHKNIPFTHVE
ncbi:zinc finger protein basonuclin-2 isoform X3 [Ambystoma mexicanum]|uniref:zinc finger protein basonuclin-2 isoform X3 n=1 Tax=Ambystoma mexicanum TaxID=8296 RepID=UPI0037E93AF5